jgi:hypothetical protein
MIKMDEKIKQSLTEFILRVAKGEVISDKEVEILPEIVMIVLNSVNPQ